MFRAAPRLIARSALPRSVAPARRFISTAPPAQRSRGWKNSFIRLGIAGTIIYYYNTTDVFAEEPRELVQSIPETENEIEQLPTIESISAERQKRKAVQAQLELQQQKEVENVQRNGVPADTQGGMEGIEEEAGQQGAFNPETGEINWDCPCLGGMADGPCGPEFKAAFSCFVYSTEEPKGMDCIDKFKDMQNCFRKYPEVYGSELDSDADDDEDLPSGVAAPMTTVTDTESSLPSETPAPAVSKAEPKAAAPEKAGISGERDSKPQVEEKKNEESGVQGLVPKNYIPDTKSD